MRNINKKLTLWLGLFFLLIIACQTLTPNNSQPDPNTTNQSQIHSLQEDQPPQEATNPPEQAAPPVSQTDGEMDFFQQLDSQVITLQDTLANSQDEETYGPILTLQLTNPGTQEILVSVPCGLVFIPSDDSNQRLMTVQPLQVTLAPGETQTPKPYVVCIDITASAPGFSDTYSVGTLVENQELLKFAECICGQQISTDITSMDGVGVQMAAWSVSIGGDFSTLMDQNGAMADMFENELGADQDEAISQFMQMISMFGDEWLDECQIEIEK